MTLLHKLLLSGEIFSASVAGLVALSAAIATVRAIVSKTSPSITVAQAMAKASVEGWPHRMLVAFDIAFNVIVLRGQQDETISTHSWRAQQEGKLWGKLMCKWLNGFQPNHGFQAACGDLERATARVAVLRKSLGLS